MGPAWGGWRASPAFTGAAALDTMRLLDRIYAAAVVLPGPGPAP
jgi:hypothetical protein